MFFDGHVLSLADGRFVQLLPFPEGCVTFRPAYRDAENEYITPYAIFIRSI